MLRLLPGMAILIAFHGLGLLIQHYGRLPLPGSVIGLLLFIAALRWRIIRLQWVEQSAAVLLRHMLLFFVPVIVGVMGLAGLLAEQWLPIVVTLTVGTMSVLIVTGVVTKMWDGKRATEDERS